MIPSTFSKITTLLILCVIAFSCGNDNEIKNQKRSKTNINNDWLYLENSTSDSNEALKKSNWQTINLPHTWNALDATDLEPG